VCLGPVSIAAQSPQPTPVAVALGDGTTKGIIDIALARRPEDALPLVGLAGSQLIPEDAGTESKWVFERGVLTASPKWDSVITKDSYRDFRLHLEFNVNEREDTNPEAKGNSGVYIQQRYELQILDSFGVAAKDYKASYCGSLYRMKKPDRLVSKKAGAWQSFDIAFRAARYADGKKIENARITAYQNQQLIHDDFEIPRKTGAGKKEGPDARPIKLQGHHNPVRFRNVWIQQLNLDRKPVQQVKPAQKVKSVKQVKPATKKGYTYVIPFDQIPPAPALRPAQALDSFQLHEDFEISVAASDPMIESPVAIRFDGDGRMWVVEMRAYMLDANAKNQEDPIGRISILTDTNQDGVFDDYKVFLDRLVLPRSIAFYKQGILYGGHQKLYYVENVNDVAGEMMVIDENYTQNQNVEHRTNGLLRGLDNWIYNVKSDARYREFDGEWVKELTSYRGQWGLSQDDYGRLYYNENWFGMKADQLLPNTLMRNFNSFLKMGDTAMMSYRDKVFPARITPGVNRGGEGAIDDNGYLTAVTAACGPVVYRGDQFPEKYRRTAFFCEPSAHFVRMLDLTEQHGLTSGKHALQNREFLASTDERFRPVNLCNGPDGSLFLVDLYHGIVQHKAYLTRYLREHVEHRDLASHPRLGRVYRIRYRDNPLGPQPRMLQKRPADLVADLSHPNGWWRDTAQQLLIDRQDQAVVPALNVLAADAQQPLGQIHALWTLEGLAAVNITAIDAALQSANRRVVEMAIRLSELLTEPEDVARLLPRFSELAMRTEIVILRQLAASLGRFPGDEPLMLLAKILKANVQHKFFREVAIHGLEGREARFEQLLGKDFRDEKLLGYLRHCLSLKTTAAAHPTPRDTVHLASFERGEQVFLANCIACHGVDGLGLPMLGPPLVGSEWATGSTSRLAAILLQGMMGPIKVGGQQYVPAAAMPGLKTDAAISDAQLADVATFVRFAWGNKKSAVKPKHFAAIRASLKDRDTAFSAAELRKRFPK
jgi:mono/diheme cytochrome c family protein/glucose/arabinose dehydrogenase